MNNLDVFRFALGVTLCNSITASWTTELICSLLARTDLPSANYLMEEIFLPRHGSKKHVYFPSLFAHRYVAKYSPPSLEWVDQQYSAQGYTSEWEELPLSSLFQAGNYLALEWLRTVKGREINFHPASLSLVWQEGNLSMFEWLRFIKRP